MFQPQFEFNEWGKESLKSATSTVETPQYNTVYIRYRVSTAAKVADISIVATFATPLSAAAVIVLNVIVAKYIPCNEYNCR